MSYDPFAPFQLEPGPALDAEKLKERFVRETAGAHPDKFQQAPEAERLAAEQRYAELALYELSKGEKPRDVQRIPPGTMDLFIEVGQACRELDAFLEKKREAGSALARAALAGDEMGMQETLMQLGLKLENLAASLEKDLAALDAKWRAGERDLAALEAIYRKYSYLARWREQLQEREIALLTGE